MRYLVWTLSGLVICSALCSAYLSVRRPGAFAMGVGALTLALLGTEFLIVGDQPRWIVVFLYAVACLGIVAAFIKARKSLV
jgi:hypothetical protein